MERTVQDVDFPHKHCAVCHKKCVRYGVTCVRIVDTPQLTYVLSRTRGIWASDAVAGWAATVPAGYTAAQRTDASPLRRGIGMISTRRHRLHPRGARSAARTGLFDRAVPAPPRLHAAPSSSSPATATAADPRVPPARVHIETTSHTSTRVRTERTPDPRG